MDIIENSITAKANFIDIIIEKNETKNFLKFKISDNGFGMDDNDIEKAINPFFTSKSKRKIKVGLGIPLFKQNAELCNGFFNLESKKNAGTIITVQFELDNIDRMPLGNLGDTILTSIIGHTNVDFKFELKHMNLKFETTSFILDTRPIKEELDEIPINYPDVIQYLDELINNGIKKTYMEEH
jgi:hypothetical protein